MKNFFTLSLIFGLFNNSINAQNPIPFSCNSADSIGYYISSASSTQNSGVLTYSKSRLSKIETPTGARTTLCSETQIGVAMNAMGFNPVDNYLYAVSRFDATEFSGKLYRIGENCEKQVIPVTGSIAKFLTNNISSIDAAGGNISSGTFDLENNYYVNTSFINSSATGFTNKIQKIKINGNTASVVSSRTLTCPSCSTSTKVIVTDIIFDETTNKLYGSNRVTNKLYQINAATGVMTPVGNTGITASILGMYKNVYGDIRAIDATGKIYGVNVLTGAFTFLNSQAALNSSNADAASGCYDPPSISGNVFVDANGLNDNQVSGTGVSILSGNIPLFANLIQNNLIVRSTPINADGSYIFLGLFSGTYEVQIATVAGLKNSAAPLQDLPSTHAFVGDFIGAGAGSDGTANGKLTVVIPVGGGDVNQVNFGIDALPVATDVSNGSELNPGGTTQVNAPALDLFDEEDGLPTTVIIVQIPNPATEGILYYNGIAVINNQVINNFQDNLLTFDPIDGLVTAVFTYAGIDAAGVQGNNATGTMEFTNALPVELISFNGKYKNKEVQLNWTTASEENSSHFVVERSAAGIEFEELEEVLAAGNSSEMITYEAVDKAAGIYYYYRIKAVDTDETFAYSNTIYVAHPKEIDVQVYPTIVQDELTIRLNNEEQENEKLSIKLFSSDGKEILFVRLTDQEQIIDFEDKTAGTYSLVISDGAGNRLFVKKIVKQ